MPKHDIPNDDEQRAEVGSRIAAEAAAQCKKIIAGHARRVEGVDQMGVVIIAALTIFEDLLAAIVKPHVGQRDPALAAALVEMLDTGDPENELPSSMALMQEVRDLAKEYRRD